MKVTGIDVPLTLQSGTSVHPGDYIIADLNGVVVLPVALAEKVISVIGPMMVADDKMAEAIRGGMSVVDAQKAFR